MEPGPLPPHERAWRHPSELGPTSHDVDGTASFGTFTKTLAAAASALAVMLIGAIVVTATPNSSDAPMMLSVTTNSVVSFAPTSVDRPESTRHSIAPVQAPLMVSMSAIPNEIASAPQLSIEALRVAARLPKPSEAVMIQTADVTYRCTWAEVESLEMPDGIMVADDDGNIVARVVDGEIVALAEDWSTLPTSSAPRSVTLDDD